LGKSRTGATCPRYSAGLLVDPSANVLHPHTARIADLEYRAGKMLFKRRARLETNKGSSVFHAYGYWIKGRAGHGLVPLADR